MIDVDALLLTEDQVVGITGYRRRVCQKQWFALNGVTYKERPDGSLVVSRLHFERIMGGLLYAISRDHIEPDFSTLQ